MGLGHNDLNQTRGDVIHEAGGKPSARQTRHLSLSRNISRHSSARIVNGLRLQLIAVNFVRLGKAVKGILTFTLGFIATVLNILVKRNWNTSSGSVDGLKYDAFEISFLIVMWFCTWMIAKQEQGDSLQEHLARGGQLGSRAAAFWVGIIAAVTLAAVLVAAEINNSINSIKLKKPS